MSSFFLLACLYRSAQIFAEFFLENREKTKNKMFFSQKVQFCAKKCAEKGVL